MATIGDIGAASAEWLAFADRTRLPPLPHENTDLRNLRRAANEARSRDSRSEMEELGNMEIWTLQLDDKILSFDLGIVDMKMVCIATKDQTEIPGKLFSPPLVPSDGGKLPVVLYFHGGGFLSGSSFTEDATCSRLALNCHVLVVSIIYRHTPEWTAPTQMNDAWGARNWVSSNIQNYNGDINRVVVAGISSGGCLAAGIALKEAKVSQDNNLDFSANQAGRSFHDKRAGIMDALVMSIRCLSLERVFHARASVSQTVCGCTPSTYQLVE